MAPVADSQVEKCFLEIINTKPINVNKFKTIIDHYCPIHKQQIQPLTLIINTKTNQSKDQRNLEEQFYQEKFIPSPDLLLNYQQTFIKSLRQKETSTLVNNKLFNLYQKNPGIQSNPYAAKTNLIQQPATLPYHNITTSYNYFPALAENKRVFVEQREQLILKELKQKQKVGIQMSIPFIQQSLMDYEIKNLKAKNITLENLGKLSSWKSKREELQSKLNAR